MKLSARRIAPSRAKYPPETKVLCTSCGWEGTLKDAKLDENWARCPKILGKRLCNRRLRRADDSRKDAISIKAVQELPKREAPKENAAEGPDIRIKKKG